MATVEFPATDRHTANFLSMVADPDVDDDAVYEAFQSAEEIELRKMGIHQPVARGVVERAIAETREQFAGCTRWEVGPAWTAFLMGRTIGIACEELGVDVNLLKGDER